MTAPQKFVAPSPRESKEVHEGRAPALCEGCMGHHGPVNAYYACILSKLAVSRARVAELEAQIARDADDTERGRKAREAVDVYARLPGSRRAATKDGRP